MSIEKPYLPNNPELKHEVLLERIRELQASIQEQQTKYLAERWRLDPKKVHEYLFAGDEGEMWDLVEKLSKTEDGASTIVLYQNTPVLQRYRWAADAEQGELHSYMMTDAQELLDSHMFSLSLNEARVSYLADVYSEGVAPATRARMKQLTESIGRELLELGEPIPGTLRRYLDQDFVLQATIHAAEEGAALDQGWERLSEKIEKKRLEEGGETEEETKNRAEVFQSMHEKLLRSKSEEAKILNQMAERPTDLFDALYKPAEALGALQRSN